MIITTSPEFLQQLALSTLLAERSEELGTDYEEGTYEQGARDALQWVAGILTVPPHAASEYPELTLPLDAIREHLANNNAGELLHLLVGLKKTGCPTLGPTCRGCPDCRPVMGDSTYQDMFHKDGEHAPEPSHSLDGLALSYQETFGQHHQEPQE
ncbi:hypothetical protein [Aeromonas hydrophila]|uniref:hypothetical protein n=1 Tax=Aeromonas hydrophila TaxID=644 RepID=UPI00080AAB69|nr:hypothetical protein [Aeromonas hydrophila]ANT70287.1 hypothetical protein TK34_22790 [Aeromonas hydrophila]